MAIVWAKKTKGVRYEVRSAGASIRLYTNGIFHTQWNPRRPLSGHLWDLLYLPVYFHSSPSQVKDVLVLGVGGGAVINLFHRFLTGVRVVGVDLDREHLKIAKRFFLEKNARTRLLSQDAIAFVSTEKSKYDLIVEDLFLGAAEKDADAVRPIAVDEKWLKTLSARLRQGGLLVINFENLAQLKSSLKKSRIRQCGFSAVYAFSHEKYENAVAVCLTKKVDKRVYLTHLAQAFKSAESDRLSYGVTKIV